MWNFYWRYTKRWNMWTPLKTKNTKYTEKSHIKNLSPVIVHAGWKQYNYVHTILDFWRYTNPGWCSSLLPSLLAFFKKHTCALWLNFIEPHDGLLMHSLQQSAKLIPINVWIVSPFKTSISYVKSGAEVQIIKYNKISRCWMFIVNKNEMKNLWNLIPKCQQFYYNFEVYKRLTAFHFALNELFSKVGNVSCHQ